MNTSATASYLTPLDAPHDRDAVGIELATLGAEGSHLQPASSDHSQSAV